MNGKHDDYDDKPDFSLKFIFSLLPALAAVHAISWAKIISSSKWICRRDLPPILFSRHADYMCVSIIFDYQYGMCACVLCRYVSSIFRSRHIVQTHLKSFISKIPFDTAMFLPESTHIVWCYVLAKLLSWSWFVHMFRTFSGSWLFLTFRFSLLASCLFL